MPAGTQPTKPRWSARVRSYDPKPDAVAPGFVTSKGMATRLRILKTKLQASDRFKLRLPAKEVAPFYQSAEWRTFIASVIAERSPGLMARRGHLCEDRECRARHWPSMRIFGDHIVELQDGGAPLDKGNIMLRCGASHSRKTAEERRRRAGGV